MTWDKWQRFLSSMSSFSKGTIFRGSAFESKVWVRVWFLNDALKYSPWINCFKTVEKQWRLGTYYKQSLFKGIFQGKIKSSNQIFSYLLRFCWVRSHCFEEHFLWLLVKSEQSHMTNINQQKWHFPASIVFQYVFNKKNHLL